MKLIKSVLNIFKSRYRIEIENVFAPIELLGFIKRYKIYGVEKILTYVLDTAELSIIWETKNTNPVIILKKDNTEVDLTSVKEKLLKHSPVSSGNTLKQNYWIYNLLSRDIYLSTFFEEIFSNLNENKPHKVD